MKTKKPIGKWRASALLLASTLLWTSCAADRATIPLRPGVLVPRTRALAHTASLLNGEHTFVLVAIDGVRHQDVFEGVDPSLASAHGLSERERLSAQALTPNLHALMERGAALGAPGAGAGIFASGPNFVSVPGYMELMTGRRVTGCTTNGCAATTHSTLADDFAELPGVSPLEVGVISSWDGIGRAAARNPSKVTVSVGRHQGETRDLLRYDPEASELLSAGEAAGPAPGYGDYRRDRDTAAIALRYLKRVKPRFLFLGLGDTDEHAHHDDYRGYLRALGHADYVVGRVHATLAELEREGRRTTLMVTTDHGREHDFDGHGGHAPESARVWLVAAGWGIATESQVETRSTRYLADVTATIRVLANVGVVEPSSAALSELMLPVEPRLARRP
ncbi:MAG: hypothetical protein IT377_10640 [Polyangiaceae bacterium]|nr:hypothetical protein [Polyangiaceae bacterium]